MSNAVTRKTEEEVRTLREGGRILAATLKKVARAAKEGTRLAELDRIAQESLRRYGATPSFKGYAPQTHTKPFPAAICVSVNSVVVHGIPRDQRVQAGDIVSLDLGVRYRGLYTDGALTLVVGKVAPALARLIRVTRDALARGIAAAKPGNTTGDIGYAIGQYVTKRDFSVINDLTGHGVGYAVHEAPYVPNFGSPKSGVKLVPGMVIAIEPMVAAGSGEVEMRPDGSFVTRDRSVTAHFEHTVAITKRGVLILTK